MAEDLADLDRRLLAAHARDDRVKLVSLYTCAADAAEQRGDEMGAGFYLTHAYVFALEAGLDVAIPLRARLQRMGREA